MRPQLLVYEALCYWVWPSGKAYIRRLDLLFSKISYLQYIGIWCLLAIVCLPVCLSLSMWREEGRERGSSCLSVYLCICVSVCLFVCVCVSVCLCLCISLSVSLFVRLPFPVDLHHCILSYKCMRPEATSVWGLKLLVYEALSYKCRRPEATSVWGLKLLLY
jgi:hypothetical protein